MRKKSEHKGRVFHFSGGRTSAYMVIHFWQPGDLVIFCDTGRENKDTYRFISDFQKYTSIPVIILKSDWRKEVIIAEKMLPNRFKSHKRIYYTLASSNHHFYFRSIFN